MQRLPIITLVALIHLALVLALFHSCNFNFRRLAKSGSAEVVEGAAGPAGEGGDAEVARSTPPPHLGQIPFSYVSRRLSPAVEARQTACTTGILIDWDRQAILWRKAADRPVPIASMTKMMTALLLVERVESDPAISLATQVRVTREANQIGGSQVYLDPRETFSLDELLKCIMIFSANDAAYLIGQFLAGDVGEFVDRMNARAKELGMEQATFSSPHGLTDSDSGEADRATATEMAFLAALLLERPEVVKWSSTRLAYIREDSERFDPFQLVNRNRLISTCEGVDGMKTGYTRKAGFCVAATAKRDGRRLIAVVAGCSTGNDRDELVRALFEWGYEQ